MYRKTPFKLEEAKAYLIESVKEWDDTSQDDKIISLAGMAYNRRNKSIEVSTTAKLNVVRKNLNDIEDIIARMIGQDINANTSALETQRGIFFKEEEMLKAQLAKEPPKKPRIKKTSKTSKSRKSSKPS